MLVVIFSGELHQTQEEKQQFINNIKNLLIINLFIIMPNNYPYHFEDDIKHLVFWYKGNICMNEAYHLVLNHNLHDYSRNNLILFCNEQYLKSIPEINHYHLLLNMNLD